jgi:hypothetical protein
MEIISSNLDHVFVAFTVGVVIGLFLRCHWALFLIISCAVSGLFSLVVAGDWKDFFKHGFTSGHLIHLAGLYVIAVVFFGPFGAVSSAITRLIKTIFIKC